MWKWNEMKNQAKIKERDLREVQQILDFTQIPFLQRKILENQAKMPGIEILEGVYTSDVINYSKFRKYAINRENYAIR